MNAIARMVVFLLLLAAWPASAQMRVERAPGVNGAGVAKGSLTIPSGSMLQINMATPATPSGVASQIAGSDLAAGIYQITVVGVDPAGGLTLAPAAVAVTVAAGGLGKIVVSYVAPVGAVSTRVYTSLAGGATPDRYFTSTSATTYALTTVTGATVAALPTAATAYRMSIGGTSNWFGAKSLFPDGTASAPSIAFTSDPTLTGIYKSGNSLAVAFNSARVAYFDASGVVSAAGAFSNVARTITANTYPIINLTETWNEGSTTFAGIKYVITDTASAAGSLPFQILGGAAGTTSLLSLTKAGLFTAVGFQVGATPGIDKTCGGPVISATWVKGILTAMTCTSEPQPTPDELMTIIMDLHQRIVSLESQLGKR